jgi:probable HAF family extracellular repeat protein
VPALTVLRSVILSTMTNELARGGNPNFCYGEMMKRLWWFAYIVIPIGICAGCGGGSGGGASSGNITLSVSISGLPSGIAASVTVTGPAGYSQQLASTQTLEVNSGSYTITAKPVTHASSLYEPSTVVQTATVSASAPASIRVVYSILSYNYAAIDYPGAVSTVAMGINNSGQISGWYTDENGNNHGFVYSGSTFTSFDCPLDTSAPGSITETWAYGISDSGNVVGYCMDVYPPYSPMGGGFGEYGFLYANGYFTAINFPNALETFPAGINANGTLAGSYENDDTDPEGDAQGFTYDADSRSYTSIDFSGATDTEMQAINNSGELLGYAMTDGPTGSVSITGFTYTGGQFSVLDIAGIPNGINDFGQIAGYYYPESSLEGFASMNGILIQIAFPGSNSTFASAINNSATIAGYYLDSSQVAHGFAATPTASQ